MRYFLLAGTLFFATFSQAKADVTLTINNKDFPSGSACKGTGETVVKLTEGKKYDLTLASDCSVVVKNVQ